MYLIIDMNAPQSVYEIKDPKWGKELYYEPRRVSVF